MKKNRILYVCTALFLLLSIQACDDDDTLQRPEKPEPLSSRELDLSQFDNGSRVMMQAFYWDVEPKGEWYQVISEHLEDWAASGVDRIWLPPVSKGQSGINSMGYDPSDYFDLGEFDQHGTIKTRFGSKQELINLIEQAHTLNLEVIADIVLGHNSGGGRQENPFRPGDTEVYSLFNEQNGNASGKFNRSYQHFHPNDIHANDEQALFFPKTDLCHDQEYVQNWLWKQDNSVAEYYKNEIGFDGWRFDYVKSFSPDVVKAWNDKVGGFSVGENFDGNPEVLKEWVEASGSPAFDFACFYKLEEALDRFNDLSILGQPMLRTIYPEQAVTFVANHDTEKDPNVDNRISAGNKLMAYAYILTHSGYPTLFYSDYENDTFNTTLKKLVALHNSLATGTTDILEINKEEYVMRRNGTGNNPGIIVYLNLSNQTKTRTVQSNWKNREIVDYAGKVRRLNTTDAEGLVTIQAPPKNFSIWSVTQETK